MTILDLDLPSRQVSRRTALQSFALVRREHPSQVVAFTVEHGVGDVVDPPLAAFEHHGVGQLLARAVAAGELGPHPGPVVSFRNRSNAERDQMVRLIAEGVAEQRGRRVAPPPARLVRPRSSATANARRSAPSACCRP